MQPPWEPSNHVGSQLTYSPESSTFPRATLPFSLLILAAQVFGDSNPIEAHAVQAALEGMHVRGAHRKGKQLWRELSSEADEGGCRSLLVHMGMTGKLIARAQDAAPHDAGYATHKTHGGIEDAGIEDAGYVGIRRADAPWPPRFTKFEMRLSSLSSESEIRVAFTDPRRLGRLLLRGGSPLLESPLSDLAPDPVLSPPSVEEFRFFSHSIPISPHMSRPSLPIFHMYICVFF